MFSMYKDYTRAKTAASRKINLPLLIFALILLSISIWQIAKANSGLKISYLFQKGLPLTILTQSTGNASQRPLVLVAHGFSGSEVLMRGFSLTLAHAGYTVAAWDFPGHAANPQPLDYDELQQAPEIAVRLVKQLNLADTSRLAILGHSMGSGVALDFASRYPDVSATIAV